MNGDVLVKPQGAVGLPRVDSMRAFEWFEVFKVFDIFEVPEEEEGGG